MSAAQSVGALTANILFGSRANNDPDLTQVPTSVSGGGQPVIAFHDAGLPSALGLSGYSTCAYDVHALLNASSMTPRMWQLGGFTSNYTNINTISYTATGNWSQGTSLDSCGTHRTSGGLRWGAEQWAAVVWGREDHHEWQWG